MTDIRPCEIADALELVGERWALLIVRELFWGNHRFTGIAERTGAPRDILSTRLKRLVDAGVVERRPYSERPPRSEYHLTASGRALSPVLLSLQEWAIAHLPRAAGREPAMRRAHHDHRLRPISHFTCAECGEAVA